MILTFLLLTQAAAWPAIPTKATARLDRGPGVILELASKIALPITTEEVLLFPSKETVIQVGSATLRFSSGLMTLDNGRFAPVSALPGAPLDLAITRSNGDVKIFSNGSLFTTLKLKGKVIPLGCSGSGLELISQAVYNRILTPAELKKNAEAGIKMANSLPDSPVMTLDLKLIATTEAPDPNRIKPYRNALIAQEYTVQSVIAGHTKGLKQGAKVRVFRYGVFDGKKTGVDNLKAAPMTVTVELMSANPARSHEYQIDDLDSDMLAKYYVEVAAPKK